MVTDGVVAEKQQRPVVNVHPQEESSLTASEEYQARSLRGGYLKFGKLSMADLILAEQAEFQ